MEISRSDIPVSLTAQEFKLLGFFIKTPERGDIAAFEELVRRYDRKLLRIAYQVTHNTEDTQEAVQEAFLKAIGNSINFRGNRRSVPG